MIRLISPGWNFDTPTIPGIEILQEWTLNEQGNLRFLSWKKDNHGNSVIKREIEIQLSLDTTQEILNILSSIDQFEYLDYIAKWELYIDENKISGSMSGKVFAQGIDVTDYLRQSIPIDSLWAFNNTDRQDLGMMYCME